jgi:hypothetical protein
MSSDKHVLTYAIRDVDKIVWKKHVSTDGLTSTYVSKAPVCVPHGKYDKEVIGEANISFTVVKSAFSDEILTRQFVDSVVFSTTKTPIRGESIIAATVEKDPIIKKIADKKDKYHIYFKDGIAVDGRADFSQSLGDFCNWTGRSTVEFKDNKKYITVTYVNYVGAKELLE